MLRIIPLENDIQSSTSKKLENGFACVIFIAYTNRILTVDMKFKGFCLGSFARIVEQMICN